MNFFPMSPAKTSSSAENHFLQWRAVLHSTVTQGRCAAFQRPLSLEICSARVCWHAASPFIPKITLQVFV
jgi:hypothetical protein